MRFGELSDINRHEFTFEGNMATQKRDYRARKLGIFKPHIRRVDNVWKATYWHNHVVGLNTIIVLDFADLKRFWWKFRG
jgi:hypothetical protein